MGMKKSGILAAALLCSPHVGTHVDALDTDGGTDLNALARLAASDDARAAGAITSLRSAGPAGLIALLRSDPQTLGALRNGTRTPQSARLRTAIDHVSGQRDGHSSGLFWFTDADRARAAARELGRPILSLRMLGRLDEEMSCANSRFFRLMLYPDAEVREILASKFVLHWSSERERAPRVTIDMGDGRTLERTITGNSIHYVLDERGQPVDAIPGLYTPAGFASALEASHDRWRRCGPNRACLARLHRRAVGDLERRWTEMRRPAAPTFDGLLGFLATPPNPDAPAARLALPIAVTKAFVEMPVLDAMQGGAAVPPTPAPAWATWADLPAVRFGSATRGLMRLKSGQTDTRPMQLRFASAVGTDELQNEMGLRRRIHERFSSVPNESFEALNAFVYRDIFLTPQSDPWLGLVADDIFDGIERN